MPDVSKQNRSERIASTTSHLPPWNVHYVLPTLCRITIKVAQSRYPSRLGGAQVRRQGRSNDYEATQEALMGQSLYDSRPLSRHSPAEGGESFATVALRAEAIIRMILSSHGVELSEAPEFLLDEKTTTTSAILPDGIPHVVIVSHNVFLMELYEKLQSWGKDHLAFGDRLRLEEY
ncbi:hypothetical protein JOM56_014622 [Amanita muscaria]